MSTENRINKAALCFSLLAATWFLGCATPAIPNVATYEDPFSGLRTDLIPENLLATEGSSGELVWLDAARVFRTTFDFKYYLQVRYQSLPSTGHLAIVPGQSLLITADGKEIRFSGMGSIDPKNGPKGTLIEIAIYEATAENLRTIAKASKVDVTILGRDRSIHRSFEKVNFDRFADFVSQTTRP